MSVGERRSGSTVPAARCPPGARSGVMYPSALPSARSPAENPRSAGEYNQREYCPVTTTSPAVACRRAARRGRTSVPSEPMRCTPGPVHPHPATRHGREGHRLLETHPCTEPSASRMTSANVGAPGSRARQTTAIEPSSVPSSLEGVGVCPVDDRAPLRLVGRRDGPWVASAGWGTAARSVVATLCQTATPPTTQDGGATAPTAPRSRRARTRRVTSAYGGRTTRSWRTGQPARSGRSDGVQTTSSSLDGSSSRRGRPGHGRAGP